ncbi:MAG: polysaccharide deacetylase family protein [Mangrovibacterium sp.]
MKKLTSIILLLQLSMGVWAQKNEVNFRVAKFKDDKACAISYTFDDDLQEHYTLVFPYFEKLGIKGTFFINGATIEESQGVHEVRGVVRTTWAQLKEMADHGHEIANHGWAHKNFNRFPFEEIKEDICKNDSAIEKNIGKPALTFCYPNNSKNKEGVAYVSKGRVGTRTFQISIGSKRDSAFLSNWIDTLIINQEWGVGMTHGITHGYDAFKDPQVFWNHLEEVKSREAQIWVATFADISAYTKEAENTNLRTEVKGKQWIITPDLDLKEAIFNQPLTMVVEALDIKKVVANQDGKALLVKLEKDKACFEFNPYGGEIVVKIK